MTSREAREAPKVILWVGTFSSQCGACGQDVDWRATAHDEVIGYGPVAHGCGAVFTHVAATYFDMDAKVAAMRPDLTSIPMTPSDVDL
jgi:hypothetical protein